MIKYKLILFIIIINSKCFTQDYIQYNKTISDAIEYVLDSNYNKALVKFDSAFKYFKPFPGDTYLATQVALIQNKKQKAESYLLIGASVGLGLSSLNYPIFTEFKLEDDYDLFQQKFNKTSAIYYSTLNHKYRNDCIDLVIRDQEANKTHSILNILKPYAKYTDKKLNKELVLILIDLDSLIIENKGLMPFRSTIGVRSFEYNKTMPKNSEGIQYFLLATIFWHSPCIFSKWEKQLDIALKTGEISARTYATIRTFCGQTYSDDWIDLKERNKMKYKDHKYFVRWPEYMNQEDENIINIERRKIGLFSMGYEFKMKKAQNNFYYQLKQFKKIKQQNLITINSYKINYNYYSL